MKAHILQTFGNTEAVRENYESALQVPELRAEPKIWIAASNFEIELQMFTKARTLLQKARIKLQTDEVWVESINLEILSDNLKIARNLCSQALQKFPKSGRIWALIIQLEPISTRKSKATEALKTNDSNPWIFLEISKLFLSEKNTAKTIKFLKQALTLDQDNGDVWMQLLKVTEQPAEREALLEEFENADPCHGYLWPKGFKKVENWAKSKREIILSLIK